jgi:hypothetical protein
MRPPYDVGEPITRGRRDLRAVERRALGDALFAAAVFGGVVLVNGILAILLIELARFTGWWASPEAVEGAAIHLSAGIRSQVLEPV